MDFQNKYKYGDAKGEYAVSRYTDLGDDRAYRLEGTYRKKKTYMTAKYENVGNYFRTEAASRREDSSNSTRRSSTRSTNGSPRCWGSGAAHSGKAAAARFPSPSFEAHTLRETAFHDGGILVQTVGYTRYTGRTPSRATSISAIKSHTTVEAFASEHTS